MGGKIRPRCPRQFPNRSTSVARSTWPRQLPLPLAGSPRSRPLAYPLRVEYDLTPAGNTLVPLIDSLGQWWETTSAIPEASGPSVHALPGAQAQRNA
ncbi:protein of unknown function [Agrobacterium pusense]|uniref:HTH hxlR-type domain-containing protein n=1 Tax=Agrobacterium pusense TaxID=648995 RepID=U4QCZ9_9HYPH|nr:protein of unknown function [Agrobacterium pusense]